MPGDQLWFDNDEWNGILADVALPALTGFIRNGANAANAELYRLLITGGMLGERAAEITGAFDVTNPEVARWLADYGFKFARKVNQTTADALRTTLTEGLSAGETIRELQARVIQVFGPETTRYRAEMIARTESLRAQTAGQMQAWQTANDQAIQMGEQPIYTGKVWRISPDACDFCVEMDGRQISIGGVYFYEGDRLELEDGRGMNFGYEDVDGPPAHPNCRCVLEPMISEVWL